MNGALRAWTDAQARPRGEPRWVPRPRAGDPAPLGAPVPPDDNAPAGTPAAAPAGLSPAGDELRRRPPGDLGAAWLDDDAGGDGGGGDDGGPGNAAAEPVDVDALPDAAPVAASLAHQLARVCPHAPPAASRAHPRARPRGLRNGGDNVCFLNAPAQMLAACTPLVQSIERHAVEPSALLHVAAPQAQQLLAGLLRWTREARLPSRTVAPASIRNLFANGPWLLCGGQCDPARCSECRATPAWVREVTESGKVEQQLASDALGEALRWVIELLPELAVFRAGLGTVTACSSSTCGRFREQWPDRHEGVLFLPDAPSVREMIDLAERVHSVECADAGCRGAAEMRHTIRVEGDAIFLAPKAPSVHEQRLRTADPDITVYGRRFVRVACCWRSGGSWEAGHFVTTIDTEEGCFLVDDDTVMPMAAGRQPGGHLVLVLYVAEDCAAANELTANAAALLLCRRGFPHSARAW